MPSMKLELNDPEIKNHMLYQRASQASQLLYNFDIVRDWSFFGKTVPSNLHLIGVEYDSPQSMITVSACVYSYIPAWIWIGKSIELGRQATYVLIFFVVLILIFIIN